MTGWNMSLTPGLSNLVSALFLKTIKCFFMVTGYFGGISGTVLHILSVVLPPQCNRTAVFFLWGLSNGIFSPCLEAT